MSFILPATRAKKMDENNQIPQKDISIRFNFGIASANQEGTGESLWYSNPKKSSRGFQYGIDFLRHHKYIGYGLPLNTICMDSHSGKYTKFILT